MTCGVGDDVTGLGLAEGVAAGEPLCIRTTRTGGLCVSLDKKRATPLSVVMANEYVPGPVTTLLTSTHRVFAAPELIWPTSFPTRGAVL